MPRFTAVLFDLDGTLLDTLDDLTAATNTALAACGLSSRTREEVRSFVGNGIEMLIQRALGEAHTQREKALQIFREYYALHQADATAPYPGIQHMLIKLQDAGINMGIVSNKNDTNVKALALRFFNMSVAIGDRPGIARKPSPDNVWAAMHQLGAQAAHTLYIGDSDVDVQTAQNAGLPFLAVSWGFQEPHRLLRAGVLHLAHSPEDVVNFVLG